jgi:hypothetical protein
MCQAFDGLHAGALVGRAPLDKAERTFGCAIVRLGDAAASTEDGFAYSSHRPSQTQPWDPSWPSGGLTQHVGTRKFNHDFDEAA